MKKLLYILPFFFFAHTAFASFGYVLPVVIDHTKVPSTQTNFPVDIDITNASLKTVANGGTTQNSNGYDIYAYSDGTCTTRIPIERETYTGTTGQYTGHAKVASLSSSVDATIYLCSGDSGISTDPNSDGTYGKTSVWDANYKEVYHMTDTITSSSGTETDSTASTNNITIPGTLVCCGGTPNIANATGKIGTAVNFINASEYGPSGANSASNSGVGTGLNITLESWVNMSTTGVYDLNYNDYLGIDAASSEIGLSVDNTSAAFGISNANGSQHLSPFVSGSATGVWQHIVGTYDGTTQKVYINGSLVTSSALTVGRTNDGLIKIGGNDSFYLGDRSTGIKMDEVRVSNTVRLADWITTEYNNQSATSTFYKSVGPQTSLSTTPLLSRMHILALTTINGLVTIN